MNNELEYVQFSKEEEAYRRGYSQGFAIARREPNITIEEVYQWRHSNDETGPPGSIFDEKYVNGIRS